MIGASSTLDAPATTSPSSAMRSPGRTRKRVPTVDLLDRHQVLAAIVAEHARLLGRELHQLVTERRLRSNA